MLSVQVGALCTDPQTSFSVPNWSFLPRGQTFQASTWGRSTPADSSVSACPPLPQAQSLCTYITYFIEFCLYCIMKRKHKSHKHNANEIGVIRRAQAEQRRHQQMLSRIKRITWASMDARPILCCGPSTQNALSLAYHVAHSLTNFPSHCSELGLLVGLPWPSCFQSHLPLHPLFSGSSLLCSALSPPHPIALITG